MFDTHVNLHGEKFDEDLPAVLKRARDVGVSHMLAICDRLDSLRRIRAITDNHENIWCSVGVHPHYADDYTNLTVEVLIDKAKDPNTVAIGETGLDFHYGYSSKDAQINCLKKHIDASRKLDLPLILHTRNADNLMSEILESEFEVGPFLPLLHCYTGGLKLLDRGLALGAFVSASGIITFKNASEVRSVIKSVPLDRIVVETDCPYLSPVPKRGQRNEPSFLPYVIENLADSVSYTHLTLPTTPYV